MIDPVIYTIAVRHWLDGEIEAQVRDLADDAQSRRAVAAALRQAAEVIEREAAQASFQ